jgi:hypothetical protein
MIVTAYLRGAVSGCNKLVDLSNKSAVVAESGVAPRPRAGSVRSFAFEGADHYGNFRLAIPYTQCQSIHLFV